VREFNKLLMSFNVSENENLCSFWWSFIFLKQGWWMMDIEGMRELFKLLNCPTIWKNWLGFSTWIMIENMHEMIEQSTFNGVEGSICCCELWWNYNYQSWLSVHVFVVNGCKHNPPFYWPCSKLWMVFFHIISQSWLWMPCYIVW
jgi:hypothetical protein